MFVRQGGDVPVLLPAYHRGDSDGDRRPHSMEVKRDHCYADSFLQTAQLGYKAYRYG